MNYTLKVFLNLVPILIMITMSFGPYSFSQTPAVIKQVIGSAGGSKELSNNYLVDYTIGEIAVFTLKNDMVNKQITQGFHQKEYTLIVDIEKSPATEVLGVKVFPNPTNSVLNISFSNPHSIKDIEVQILDIKGRMLTPLQHLPNDNVNHIDCRWLPAGQYLLQFRSRIERQMFAIPFSKIK